MLRRSAVSERVYLGAGEDEGEVRESLLIRACDKNSAAT